MPEARDYYSILGVHPTADIIVIRAAYRALAQKYHPDTWRGEKSESDARMRELNEASETLSNNEKRKRYDAQRKLRNDNNFDFGNETMRSRFGEALATAFTSGRWNWRMIATRGAIPLFGCIALTMFTFRDRLKRFHAHPIQSDCI